jgi:predicted DNA-binding WGR domain protein
MARFYGLSVSPTLFPGEWVLVRRWGRIGNPA